MTIAIVIRWIVSLALVIVIWLHAHWSVAFSLTVLLIRGEVEHWTLTRKERDFQKCIKEIDKVFGVRR